LAGTLCAFICYSARGVEDILFQELRKGTGMGIINCSKSGMNELMAMFGRRESAVVRGLNLQINEARYDRLDDIK
jgi:hypothetical protein